MNLRAEEFLGVWHVARRIEDALSAMVSTFEGQATIEDTGAHWIYREQGVLSLQGSAQMRAERTYHWQPRAGGIDVFFDDDRFFHHMPLSGSAEAAHWCDPDQYDVRYDFSGWPEWQSVWSVKGPRKDYRMESKYRR